MDSSRVGSSKKREFFLLYRVLSGYVVLPPKKRKTIVGLERCPLSLVSTTEELLDRKVAAPV
jgi:hypothetical protein